MIRRGANNPAPKGMKIEGRFIRMVKASPNTRVTKQRFRSGDIGPGFVMGSPIGKKVKNT